MEVKEEHHHKTEIDSILFRPRIVLASYIWNAPLLASYATMNAEQRIPSRGPCNILRHRTLQTNSILPPITQNARGRFNRTRYMPPVFRNV